MEQLFHVALDCAECKGERTIRAQFQVTTDNSDIYVSTLRGQCAACLRVVEMHIHEGSRTT